MEFKNIISKSFNISSKLMYEKKNIHDFNWEGGKPSKFNPRSLKVDDMEWFLQLKPSQNNPTELEIIIPLTVS